MTESASTAGTPPSLLVVGSVNLDFVCRVDQLPRPGQTLQAKSFARRFGGKGANQAVAAARQGASVALVASIGDEDSGHFYLSRLQAEGIDTSGVVLSQAVPTGSAFITVNETGENTIVITPGANADLSPAHVEAQSDKFAAADYLLLQNEVPPETRDRALELAAEHDTRIIFNPAPYPDANDPFRLPHSSGATIEWLIMNASEAKLHFGELPEKLEVLTSTLKTQRVRHLIVTRGSSATWALIGGLASQVPPPARQAIDTTGAGDAFVGALAAALLRGEGADDPNHLVEIANEVASLATQAIGAQEGMPRRSALA